jgi:hypothetical protein
MIELRPDLERGAQLLVIVCGCVGLGIGSGAGSL